MTREKPRCEEIRNPDTEGKNDEEYAQPGIPIPHYPCPETKNRCGDKLSVFGAGGKEKVISYILRRANSRVLSLKTKSYQCHLRLNQGFYTQAINPVTFSQCEGGIGKPG